MLQRVVLQSTSRLGEKDITCFQWALKRCLSRNWVVLPKDSSSSSRRDSAVEALSRGGWLGLLLWLPSEPARRLGGGGRTGMEKAKGLVETAFEDWEGGAAGWGGLGVSSPARSISVSVVSGGWQERKIDSTTPGKTNAAMAGCLEHAGMQKQQISHDSHHPHREQM